MASGNFITFPNDPLLVRLLQSSKLTDEVIIHDAYGFDKTYPELLADIHTTRNAIRASLPPSALTPQGLVTEKHQYIGALTLGGYEFIVAFYAIRAVGGACLTFASGILPQEAEHYITMSGSICLLVGDSHRERAGNIKDLMNGKGDCRYGTLGISTGATPMQGVEFKIDDNASINPQDPGVVMFTSGTSGKPKGAVLPKQCLVRSRGYVPGTTLNYRPPHWRGGWDALVTPPMTGGKLVSLRQHPSAEDVWEALKDHSITTMMFNPVLLRRMKVVYEEQISLLPTTEIDRYLAGFRRLGCILCNGALTAPSLLKFWTELTGLWVGSGYGSTECGGGVVMPQNPKHAATPQVPNAIGQVAQNPPMEVKLSEGTYGEFLVKSPWMLIRYIGDEKATAEAFDEHGYLKTGDVGHITDGNYFFDGRTTTDFIRRVPRVLVEDAISNLPYVAEVIVVAVPDHDSRWVSGALIRLRQGVAPKTVSITRIHEDLTDMLPAYTRPFLLRILQDGETIPYTESQKPLAREIVRQYFAPTGYWDSELPTAGVQSWGSSLATLNRFIPDKLLEHSLKPWDWAGVQMANY
ncbi:hypothetical protein PWT90_08761 [Aphanocladium album]|nr:hypothetical protein PWT90_08761 [Aphanocladium album]